jgi:hypothetical protein
LFPNPPGIVPVVPQPTRNGVNCLPTCLVWYQVFPNLPGMVSVVLQAQPDTVYIVLNLPAWWLQFILQSSRHYVNRSPICHTGVVNCFSICQVDMLSMVPPSARHGVNCSLVCQKWSKFFHQSAMHRDIIPQLPRLGVYFSPICKAWS